MVPSEFYSDMWTIQSHIWNKIKEVKRGNFPWCYKHVVVGKAGVDKLRPTGRMRPARVYYAARRHVHVCKIFWSFIPSIWFKSTDIKSVFMAPGSITTVTFVSLILIEFCGQIVCKFSWQNTWLLSLIHIFVCWSRNLSRQNIYAALRQQ